MSSKVCSSKNFKAENIKRLSDPSYDYFVDNFMKVNLPCIFTSSVTDNWKSRKKWVTNDGEPNLDYLINNFGSSIVPVVLCDYSKGACYDRKEMLLKNYIEQNMTKKEIPSKEYFYLKDWHFNRAFPNYEAYVTPEYFKEDWLNEFCEKEVDDFKFVYMGPKGTWTSLHADVYGSYSWSANICGRKRWLLFPPGEEKSLIKSNNKLPMMNENELLDINGNSYLDVIQEAGEIIFVPSGWYHQVWNLEDTISINHNWFNGYNIEFIWNSLSIANYEVEQEISDLKGSVDWWNEHQFLLKAHHGMDLNEFFRILEFIFKKRTNSFSSKESFKNEKFDIICVNKVCEKMLSLSLPKNMFQNIMTLHELIKNTSDEKGISYKDKNYF